METKKCTTCKIEQLLSEYRKDASRSNGIHPTCNNCNKEIQRRWYKNNKEKARENSSKRYHENKDFINTKRKQLRKDNPELVRAKARALYNPITGKVSGWKNAGIKDMTYERYLQMLESQNNCCFICGGHQDNFKRQLSVDHNHETGEVRGLLCDACNGGIGRLKDSIQMLEKAIKYLKDYE
jgi:hypothetical protein